jgi:hypothetical protein
MAYATRVLGDYRVDLVGCSSGRRRSSYIGTVLTRPSSWFRRLALVLAALRVVNSACGWECIEFTARPWRAGCRVNSDADYPWFATGVTLTCIARSARGWRRAMPGPRRACAGRACMRSCALVYRGRWLGVKGRARNCAWGRHVLLVAARRIAIQSAVRAECAAYRSAHSSET